MCGLSAIGTVASIGLRVAGSIQQGREARAQANYQAQVNERNAEIQRQRIADARRRGKILANIHRGRVGELIGTQRATFAGSNVDVSSGTVNAFLEDSRVEGELDARIIENNAIREAYGYQVAEQNYRAQADLARFRGRSAERNSLLGAAFALGQGIYNNWNNITSFFQPDPVYGTGTGGRV